MSFLRSRRAAVLLAVAALAAFAVAFGWFPQAPLQRLAERRLRATFGPGTRVQSLRVVPGALRADIDGIVIESAAWTAEIPHVRVAVAPSTLLGGPFTLRLLAMEAPRITVRATHSTPATAAASRPAGAPGIVVERIDVTRGTLRYEDRATGSVSLQGLEAHGSIGGAVLDLAIDGGRWQRPVPVVIGPARARLAVSPTLEVRLASFEGGLERSRVSATGTLGSIFAPAPQLSLEGHLDLAELAPLASSTARGVVELKGHVAGTTRAWDGEVTLRGGPFAAAGWTVDRATLRAARAGGRTTIDADGELAGGRLEGNAHLDGGVLDARARLAGLRVERTPFARKDVEAATLSGDWVLRGTLGRDAATEGHLELAGRTHGVDCSVHLAAQGNVRLAGAADVDLRWTGRIEETSSTRLRSARLELDGTARGSLPPVVEASLVGTAAVAGPRGEEMIGLHGMLRSEARARVSVALDAEGLGGRAHASLDAAGATVARAHLAVDGIALERALPDARGRVRFAIDADGHDLATLNATLRGSIDALGWRGAAFGPLVVEARAARGRAVARFAAPGMGVTVDGSTRLPAHTLEAHVAIDRLPLGPLAPLMAAATPLDGQATAHADLVVPLAQPAAAHVDARLDFLELSSGARQARLSRPLRVRLDGGRLAIDDLALDATGVSLTAHGTVGTGVGGAVDLDTRIRIALDRLPPPYGSPLAGSVEADAHVGGTKDVPTLTGAIATRGVALRRAGLPPVSIADATLLLADGAITLDGLEALVAGGRVRASGTLPIVPLATGRGSARAVVDLAWQDLDAATLLGRSAAETPLVARLAGRAHVEGDARRVDTLTGAADIPQTGVRVEDQELRVEPFHVALERGRVATDGLVVDADAGSFRLAGGADLRTRALEATGRGRLDLRALQPLLADAALLGTAQSDLALAGTLDAPRLRGTLDVHDATLRLRALSQALTGIEARVLFDDASVRIDHGSAAFGGGTLALGGGVRLAARGVEDVALTISARDVGLSYPAGLKTHVDGDLALTGRTGAFGLAGDVAVTRGLYDVDVAVQSGLTAPAAAETAPLLREIGLDVRVSLASPILVQNNLGSLRVQGGLRFRGDAATPAPFGRLELLDSSTLQLQSSTANRFRVDAGSSITYQGTWNPTLSIDAHAEEPITAGASRYEVRLRVGGSLEAPEIGATSVPSLPPSQILSLLATGTLDYGGNSEKALAGEQAAALLTGRITGAIARELSGLGLGDVTIQPELAARDLDPGARFTLHKTLARGFDVLYSLSLSDPQQRFVRVSARPGARLDLTGERRDDGAFAYGAGQRIEIGGPARAASAPKDEATIRLADVRLDAPDAPPAMELRKDLGLRPGQSVTSWEVQQAGDRLHDRLAEAGHLDAVVSARVEDGVAALRVRAGPRYAWRVDGMADPPDLGAVARGALAAQEAMELAQKRLAVVLGDRGFLRARIDARVEGDGSERTLAFVVTPGPRLAVAAMTFPGARDLDARTLEAAAGGARALVQEPLEARRRVEDLYRARNYFAARVEAPQIQEAAGAVRIVVPVAEGARAQLSGVSFDGNALPTDDVADRADLPIGVPYAETDVLAAAARIRELYFERGYPAVRVNPEALPDGSDVRVAFHVSEGDRVTVRAIEIAGLTRTRRGLVQRTLALAPGEPLDPRRLAEAERRLAALGVFARATVSSAPDDPGLVRVEIVEETPLGLRYNLRYDTDVKATALGDAEAANVFGTGLTVGGRYNVGRDIREARASLSLPALFGAGSFTGSAFRLSQDFDAVDLFDPTVKITNTRIERGLRLQQDLPIGRAWNLQYSYGWKRVTSTVFPDPIDVAGLTVSAVRDTRDRPLDARSGRFLSASVELAPKALGSDFTFVKGSAQLFLHRSFAGSFTWAQGYRLGLAHGFGGQTLVGGDRFTAGGANSIRGFANDSLGPRDFLGDPTGGQALVILNQELRYRHRSGAGGVVFYDGGNVFDTVSRLSFDWRHSAGVGLRYDTPVGVLLRLDVGLPIARRDGEKAYHWFFSIGQAF